MDLVVKVPVSHTGTQVLLGLSMERCCLTTHTMSQLFLLPVSPSFYKVSVPGVG